MIDRKKDLPPRRSYVLAECEGWNDSGFQVCYYNGKEFTYNEVPNDMFDMYVTGWILIDSLI